MSMDKLPDALVAEILSRLDSADVARCRVASKTFDTVFPNVRSIHLQWPLPVDIKSYSRVPDPSRSYRVTSPFKTIFLNLISKVRVLESVYIGVENITLDAWSVNVQDYGDDLYLTDAGFIKEWLPKISGGLKSLSISDIYVFKHWPWHLSAVLGQVSADCHNLLELELKYTRLFGNLLPMPTITSLTLESVDLNDNVLSQVNKCLPNLQVLNLIHVQGLKLPKIHLLNLKTCLWTQISSPSCLTLIAPNLITLRLECIWRSTALYVEAPMLSQFHFFFYGIIGAFKIKDFENLKTLCFASRNIRSLLAIFPLMEKVENLTLDTKIFVGAGEVGDFKFTLEELFCVFPSVTSLCFTPTVWKEFEVWYGSLEGLKGLKTFRGYLGMDDPQSTFTLVACVLDQCVNLVDVSLLIHYDVAAHVSRGFICSCMARWTKVKWKWGMWKYGEEDSWITDDIHNSQSLKKCLRKASIPYLKKQRN